MIDKAVIKNRLMKLYDSFTSAGMAAPTDDEMRSALQQAMQPQQAQGMLMPQQQTQPPMQMPQQGMMGMVPPGVGQPIGTAIPQMGQASGGIMSQPNGSGFDTHIHIGQDGKLQALNIKRAVQKRMQQGGLS